MNVVKRITKHLAKRYHPTRERRKIQTRIAGETNNVEPASERETSTSVQIATWAVSTNPRMRLSISHKAGLDTRKSSSKENTNRRHPSRTVQSTTERSEKALLPSVTSRVILDSKSPTADQRTFDPNEKTPSERLIQGESAHRAFDSTTIQPGRSLRGYRLSRFLMDIKERKKKADLPFRLVGLLYTNKMKGCGISEIQAFQVSYRILLSESHFLEVAQYKCCYSHRRLLTVSNRQFGQFSPLAHRGI